MTKTASNVEARELPPATRTFTFDEVKFGDKTLSELVTKEPSFQDVRAASTKIAGSVPNLTEMQDYKLELVHQVTKVDRTLLAQLPAKIISNAADHISSFLD